MRDPNRIKPYCDILASIWQMVPDWRLGQLMMNAMLAYKTEKRADAFYAEDLDFLHFLYEYISKIVSD